MENNAPTEAPAEEATAAAASPILVGRRQPCPCGSGKKFKNCCIGDPAYEVATDGAVPQAPTAPTAAAKPGPAHAKFNKAPGHSSFNAPRPSNTVHRRKV
jgi:hypothetical protein